MVNNYDEQTADEKKEPYTLNIVPGKWALAYYSDEYGFKIEITNERYMFMQLDPATYAILKGMMANMTLLLKTYAKLGDDVK